MDFLFAKDAETDWENLAQGDLLVRNSGLQTALAQAHQYYASAPDYSHFVVLTQSCDLVRRSGKCRTRYITLAAARPLSVVTERFLAKISYAYDEFPITLCKKDEEIRARQLLERLLHNTEDGFFFIKKESHASVAEDLCVFLPLSISIRTDHYGACLDAKIAQLDEIFSAKIGWLTGNLYSRVATPDVEEKMANAGEFKEAFYKEALFENTAWLAPAQLKLLKKSAAAWQRSNPGAAIDTDAARALLEEVPSIQEIAIERAVSLLCQKKIIDSTTGADVAARNLLLSDPVLNKLIN
jgi:hypothetical protein